MRKYSICVLHVYNRVDPPRIVLTKGFIQEKRYNIKVCSQEVKQTISKGHIRLKHFSNIERAWRPRHLPKVARVAAGKFLENLWSLEETCCPFVISAYFQQY